MRIQKIVSGGQTGVDRAALDVALELNIHCGGWCPKGRWAEDAPIAYKYPLQETATQDPYERTKLNVTETDGTLILIKSLPIGKGTQLTITAAKALNKPLLVFTLHQSHDVGSITEWLTSYNIRKLNIAGPGESQNPGIYQDACSLLRQLLH